MQNKRSKGKQALVIAPGGSIEEANKFADMRLAAMYSKDNQAFIRLLESRHMSDWTDEEMCRYNKLTNQNPDQPNCQNANREHTSWPCWCGQDHSSSDLR